MLSKSMVSGLKWTSISTGVHMSSQFLSLIILARILTPYDFGVAAAGVVITTMLAHIGQMGISPALVQKEHIEASDLHTAKILAFVLAIMLALFLIHASGYIAILLRIRELEYVLPVLSVAMFLYTLSAPNEGIMQREFRFARLSGIEIASHMAGLLIVAPVCALLGAGYWSLIAGAVVQKGMRSILIMHACRISTMTGFSLISARALMRFGFGYTLARFGNVGANQGDNLVVARILGPDALGVYSRAYQLMMLPVNFLAGVADRVAFSGFSRIQNEREKIRAIYGYATTLSVVMGIPFAAIFVFFPQEVILILFGPQWSEAGSVLQVLGVVLIFRFTTRVCDPILRGLGVVFRRALVQWIFFLLVVVGAVLGARYGVEGVAYGVGVAVVVNFFLMHGLCMGITGTPITTLVADARAIILWAAIFFGSAMFVKHSEGLSGAWQELFGVTIISSLIAGCIIALAPRVLLGYAGTWFLERYRSTRE